MMRRALASAKAMGVGDESPDCLRGARGCRRYMPTSHIGARKIIGKRKLPIVNGKVRIVTTIAQSR